MLNDASIRNFLIVVAGLVLMGVGIAVLASSRRAQFSEVARTGVNALVGVIILAAGAGALLLVAFGESVLETIFPGDTVRDTNPSSLVERGAELLTSLPLDVMSLLPWA
ncbi:hypothetical protein [Phytoactinopolyspora mesophila]|uniref:Uncharacterized protein n=1 Tax=Phytoactinopolyspora mesophila TaxID=2650750 RepID=A0A7K3MD93_9ACTN|nr:hypothetical protein [Phytoactinopolyspora mesophila]NDL60962.1 hypothetical protein [Phytoactinopolyspora mesophila]